MVSKSKPEKTLILKVGHEDSVVRRYDPVQADADEARGFFRFFDKAIFVDLRLPARSQAETLVHEVLHAIICDRAPAEAPQEVEEKLVLHLAKGLCTIARDNPWFFSTVQDALTKNKQLPL